jgi:hypothetical protein
MNPRDQPFDADGRAARRFLGAWQAVTRVPLSPSMVLADKKAVPTPAFQATWQAAFGERLRSDPLLTAGMPTRAFLDTCRRVGL